MGDKVTLAIFDQDQHIRTIKKFELTSDGTKINVQSGGKAHFNPIFDNTSYLEFPARSLIPPFRRYWKRIYFVRKGASRCLNFQTEIVPAPDPEVVMEAAGAEILKNWGKDKTESPMLLYAILAGIALIVLKLFGAI